MLNDVVNFINPLLKGSAQKSATNIKIKKELSSIAPIEGVASQLREVFMNLIKNALEAMPDGGVLTLGTFMDGENVVIKVKDSGRGMPQEIRERIFDPFFTTKGVQSTGLGLSISYGIINQHYGKIEVESREGEGSTFTIYLPQAAASARITEVKAAELSSPVAPAKILIIDDEEEIRGLLQEIVSADGHVVDIAPDGVTGLEKLAVQPYDLVFTDVGMPGLSGWEVAKKVKEINQKTPVALITGYNIIFEVADLKEKGVDFVLQKPFHVAEVQQLISRGIQLKDSLYFH
jgi:CheY-like chemotaxis protein